MADPVEDETRAARARRRKTLGFYWSSAVLLALLFALAYRWAQNVGGVGPALVPIGILGLWWLLYARMIAGLDERDRAIEFRAIAVAGALLLWLIVGWSALHDIAGLAMPSGALFAPVAVIVYGVTRFVWQRFVL